MIHRMNPALILAAMVTLTLLFTQASYASDGFYTIQAGTYDYRPYAIEQLTVIRENLSDNDLTYLRVIEFRELFAVRAGRFPDHAAANRHLSAIRTLYPDAFILSVKNEKISHVLKDPPLGDPITSHNKAKELIGREEYGKALNLLSPFAADPSRYPEIASDYIVLLIWEGREKEAIRLYESLPPPFPRRLYLLENMGRAYYDEGRFEDASRLYRAALTKEPSSLEAKKGVIYSSIMEGDWPSARKQLEELITTLPNPIYVATESMTLLHSKGLSSRNG